MRTELKAQVFKALEHEGHHPGILERSGRVLMSGWDTVAPSRYYVMGLNPGGEPGIARPSETIGASLSELREDGWCAFLDEPDFKKYRRVPDVLSPLKANPRTTAISNLLFLRSPKWSSRPADSGNVFKRHCMPVHRLLLAEIMPRVIVAFGKDAGLWLTAPRHHQWGFHADVDWKVDGIPPKTGFLLLPHFATVNSHHWTRCEGLLGAAMTEASLHDPA